MGLSFGSILKGVIGFAASLWQSVHGSDSKPTLAQLLPTIIGNIMPAIDQALQFENLTTKEQVDGWLGTADALTGSDPGALDIIKGMPPDAEEEMWDGAIQMIRAYMYHRIGVPGYSE